VIYPPEYLRIPPPLSIYWTNNSMKICDAGSEETSIYKVRINVISLRPSKSI
jgi:hypothetical protein